MAPDTKTTLGEARVRVAFNTGNNDTVSEIKLLAAQLIDTINSLPEPESANPPGNNEFFRVKALAMTAIEEGAMWGVKAATA